jgi:hypothetical protein
MSMKWLFYILVFLITSACIDFDRSKYKDEIDASIEALNQSNLTLNQSFFDSIPIVLSEIEIVTNKIRTYIKQDTFSLEIALKIDEYKNVEAELIHVFQQIPVTKKDIKTVLADLKNLKKDITNNSGDRASYGVNLSLEKSNKKVLVEAVERYSNTCTKAFSTFNAIYPSIFEYTIQLELKNKEQNLIP